MHADMAWLVAGVQVLARSSKAAATIVQAGALPALAMVAGEGQSERAQLNASKVSSSPLTLASCTTLLDHIPAADLCFCPGFKGYTAGTNG